VGFLLLRLNRTMMAAMITGAAAFTAGAGASRSLWMALAGWCLAVGGFSLDFYAERDLDATGPRAGVRHNLLADGSLSPRAGLALSLAFIAASSLLVSWVAPWTLLPWWTFLLPNARLVQPVRLDQPGVTAMLWPPLRQVKGLAQ
jgi:4-hydroxybenzoate polyprenyltransferase